jgi:hypothetical protein
VSPSSAAEAFFARRSERKSYLRARPGFEYGLGTRRLSFRSSDSLVVPANGRRDAHQRHEREHDPNGSGHGGEANYETSFFGNLCVLLWHLATKR